MGGMVLRRLVHVMVRFRGLSCGYASEFHGTTSHNVIVRVIAFIAPPVLLFHGALGNGVRIDKAGFAYTGLVSDFPAVIGRRVVKLLTLGCGVHVEPFLMAVPNTRARADLRSGDVSDL